MSKIIFTTHTSEKIQVTYGAFEHTSSIPPSMKNANKKEMAKLHLKLVRQLCDLLDLTGQLLCGATPNGYAFIVVPENSPLPIYPIIETPTLPETERVIELAPVGSDANGEPMFNKVYLADEGNITEILRPLTPEDDLI